MKEKISEILYIPAHSIKDNESFWELFPPNSAYAESKKLTTFCEYVCNHYKVFLTEKEWQAKTLIELADYVDRYSSNPEEMIKRVEKEIEEMREDEISLRPWFYVTSILMMVLSYFVTEGSYERKLIIASVMGFMVLLYMRIMCYFDNKKLLRETRWYRGSN